MLIYDKLQTNIPKSWEVEFSESMEGIREACETLEDDNIDYLPKGELVFDAFNYTRKDEVKVVIVGQDPYYQPDMATGLAFSCNNSAGVIPASLKNIYKELEQSIEGFVVPDSADLTHWAKQGVLLLNMSLTAKLGKPGYKPKLWMDIIDSVVSGLTNSNRKIIWIMWGNEAQKLSKLIGDKGIKLTAAHPSPANTRGGFIGCGHFKKANDLLVKNGQTPIDWIFPI